MRRSLVLVLTLIITMPALAETDNISSEWIAKWRQDLTFLEEKLPESHADLWHTVSRDSLAAMFRDLRRDLPNLAQHEIIVRLGEIIASIGDGHTRLSWPLAEGIEFLQGHSSTPQPSSSDLVFHQFPIRIGVYDDGIFVERIEKQHAKILGTRVTKIDSVPIEEVIRRVDPVIHRDNEYQILELLPETLVLGEILHARGVISNRSRARWTIEKPDGTVETVLLETVPAKAEADWVHVFETMPGKPLSHRYLADGFSPRRGLFSKRYWFEWLPEQHAVYLQYNEVYDDDEESILEFSRRLRRFIEESPVEKLIVDLRYNMGGDNSQGKPLLHAIIASDKIRRPGGLFVITGRGTFSAAMMFAVDVEKHVAPVFVGEPTGALPNSYGDSRKILLPNSGLTVRASTLYWQYGGPRDDRAYIRPHVPASPRWDDLMAGRDAALDAILQSPTRSALAGTWEGSLSADGRTIPVTVEIDGGTGGSIRSSDWGWFTPDTVFRIRIDSKTEPIRFDAVEENGFTFHFTGRFVGPRLLGHVTWQEQRGDPLVFVLEPLDKPEDGEP